MEILESVLKTIPGLTLVFAIAALLLLEDNSEVAAAIRVFVVAWGLYRISSSLDWFFDLVYGPGPRREDETNSKRHSLWSMACRIVDEFWCGLRTAARLPGYKSLEERRDKAAEQLGLSGVKGLYGTAKAVVEKTVDWKTKVNPLIGFSKAARAFIVPFLLISIVVAIPEGHRLIPRWFLTFVACLGKLPLLAAFRADFARAQEKLEFLRYPAIPAAVCLISLSLYFLLRLRHMNKLYDLVIEKNARDAAIPS